MIIIGQPYIVRENNKSKLVSDIRIDSEVKKVYLEVDSQYEKYLCFERCDAFLIVLFYYAMRNNHDIVCECCVSEDLYYQINEYLISILKRRSHNKLNSINIYCLTAPNINNEGAVGTSVTCGVDSFYTIFNNINNKLKSKKLTHLTIMSIADSYKNNGNYTYVMNKIYNKACFVAEQLNIPLIKINSNMRELFPIPPMHTLIRMFGIYSLQKLFGTYYFSSGYPIWTFNIEDSSLIDSARYDLLLCKELSTRNLFIYSEGSQKDRLEKIEFISSFDIVKKNLHVCSNKEYNCGVCSKCVRTILELDSINKLEDYKDVFNLDFYYNNQDFYFNEALRLYKQGDIFIYDFIDKLKNKYHNDIFNSIDNVSNICSRCYRMSDYNIYINDKKYIIGICGGSGSGKTTLVNYINSKIKNSYIISVDKYMIKYLDVYKKEIINALGIIDGGKHWCNYIYNNYEDVKLWINIMKNDIERCIKDEINNAKNKVIIIDSFMLPLLDIFNYCNLKINVRSNTDIKLSRVKERLKEVGRFHLFDEFAILNRIEHTALNEYDECYDYIMDNDDNINNLDNNCKKLIKRIDIDK